MIAVLVPVLNRPQRAQPLVENIRSASSLDTRILFLCSPGDDEEIAACGATGADVEVVPWLNGPGDYARKINHGYRITDELYLFHAADDLVFHPGWDTPLLELAEQGFGVVGSDDLGNPTVMRGDHATHSLISRAYVDACGTVDECEVVMHEGYVHNFCDTELVATAKTRGAWAFAAGSRVEHRHPFWRKSVDDATYVLGRSRYMDDVQLFERRRVLWERQAVAA